jgi:hypothetical protein
MMNWCHECGEWRDVDHPTYLCSACIEEWEESRNARRAKRGSRRGHSLTALCRGPAPPGRPCPREGGIAGGLLIAGAGILLVVG